MDLLHLRIQLQRRQSAGLLLSSGIGILSVTGESLRCKVSWPDCKNRFSREVSLMHVKWELSQVELSHSILAFLLPSAKACTNKSSSFAKFNGTHQNR